MGECFIVCEVVDCYYVVEFTFFDEDSENVAPDASEAVDCVCCHDSLKFKYVCVYAVHFLGRRGDYVQIRP